MFIGTTNAEVYLRDETGGRRFWPVKVGTIRLDDLKRDRDQLFAEAVHAYNRGEHWWPGAEDERRLIVPEQEARYEADAWEAPVAEYLGRTPANEVTINHVAFHALGFERTARVGRADQNRIKAVLSKLKWRQSKKKNGAGYFPWIRPGAAA